MDLTGARKIAVFLKVLRILGDHFRLVNMSTHARAILERGGLRERIVEQHSAFSVQRPTLPSTGPLNADR
jgi:anti-anti-sigma regulatory factor